MRTSPGAERLAWWQQPLPIGRYRLEARLLDPLDLPPFAGSLLRGQFGAALRGLACRTGAPNCAGCPRSGDCTYALVFDGNLPADSPHRQKNFAQVPNPYIIAPPAGRRNLRPGDTLEWGLVLVGHAVHSLPVIAAAWHQALAQGLGPRRSRARLEAVLWLDEHDRPQVLATRLDSGRLATHRASLQVPRTGWTGGAITLDLTTPMRLQQQTGLIDGDTLTARLLLMALARRIGLLLALHAGADSALAQAGAMPELAAGVDMEARLHWHQQTRYSARQGSDMPLGGLLGSATLTTERADIAENLWPWLWAGQWLHVGKNATMGLGGYRLRTDRTP